MEDLSSVWEIQKNFRRVNETLGDERFDEEIIVYTCKVLV